jgi:hypothetical protein
MRSLRRVLGAAGLIAILTSVRLLAQDINIDYDHSFHFNQMKGYSWGKVQTSDPLVEPASPRRSTGFSKAMDSRKAVSPERRPSPPR